MEIVCLHGIYTVEAVKTLVDMTVKLSGVAEEQSTALEL
jgi:hypothetical protein